MRTKHIKQGFGKRVGAFVLAFIMMVSMIPIPAKAAEETVIALIQEAVMNEATTALDEYAGEGVISYITDYKFSASDEIKAAAANGELLRFEVDVTVNSHEFTTGAPEVLLYAMDANYGNFKSVSEAISEEKTNYTLSLDVSEYTTLSDLALRFRADDDAAKVNYTINSAKIVAGAKAVVDDDAIVTLVGSATEAEKTVIDNPYGDDYIADNPFTVTDDLKTAITGDTPLALEVSVTVHEYTCTSTQAPTVVLYAMAEGDVDWKQASLNMIEPEQTYNVSLNLADYETLGQLGMRFVGCDEGTTIRYTINSAKIVEGKEVVVDPNAKAVLADPGTKKSGVVVKNAYGVDYIVDNPFVIPHDLTFGLQGYESLALEVGVTVNAYTPGEFDESLEVGDVPYGAKVVIYAQDAKYAIWEQEYEMLGETPQTMELKLDLAKFIEDGTLGALGLRIVDCKEGTTVEYTIDYAKVTGEGESLANADLVDLKYELTGAKKELAFEDTEVGKHGKLSVQSVEGYTAPTTVDENGKPYQLRGGSTHGLSWFPKYVNKDAFQTFRDEWGMNMVRIAVYAHEGNYAYVSDYASVSEEETKAYNDELIQAGVEAATELGMYVIIDWHVLNYNPNVDLEEATAFFTKYATMYKDYENVLFEICNEPTNTEWYEEGSEQDLYTYCTKVTKAIRDCGSDAIVICGTNSYSSEVDKVSVKPLEDKNVLYTCHFYAASHYEDAQKKLTDALAAGVPVIISEFGVCTATGDGMYDLENADKWLDICDENNVSYACWAMSNSEESAAYFQSDCWETNGAWKEEQLTSTSKYIINRYRGRQEELESGEEINTIPVSKVTLDKTTVQLKVGEKVQLKTLFTPENASDKAVTWKSSSLEVASVVNGMITGVKPGTVTITVTTADGTKSAECKVTVVETIGKNEQIKDEAVGKDSQIKEDVVKVGKIEIRGGSKKIAAGKKVELEAEVSPANAANKSVTWKSSNEAYATVDANGVVTTKKAGAGKKVTITATAADESGVVENYEIQIKKHAVKKVSVKGSKKLSVKAGKAINLKSKVQIKTTGKSVNKKLKWTTSNAKYATVSASGKVKTKASAKNKTVKITACSTDGTNKKVTFTIKIKK